METARTAELTDSKPRRRRLATRSNVALAAVLTLTGAGSACGRTGDDGPSVAGDSTIAPTTQPAAPTVAPTSEPIQITYVVQSGDTLSVIASRFGVETRALADFNAIADVNTLQIGQQLNIPPATTPTTEPDSAPGPSPTSLPADDTTTEDTTTSDG